MPNKICFMVVINFKTIWFLMFPKTNKWVIFLEIDYFSITNIVCQKNISKTIK